MQSLRRLALIVRGCGLQVVLARDALVILDHAVRVTRDGSQHVLVSKFVSPVRINGGTFEFIKPTAEEQRLASRPTDGAGPLALSAGSPEARLLLERRIRSAVAARNQTARQAEHTRVARLQAQQAERQELQARRELEDRLRRERVEQMRQIAEHLIERLVARGHDVTLETKHVFYQQREVGRFSASPEHCTLSLYSGRTVQVAEESVSFGDSPKLEAEIASRLTLPPGPPQVTLESSSEEALIELHSVLELAFAWVRERGQRAHRMLERAGLNPSEGRMGILIGSQVALRYRDKGEIDMDELVARFAPAAIEQAARQHLAPLLTEETSIAGIRGGAVVLYRDGTQLATLTATQARIASGDTFRGDFLAEGEKWQEVGSALEVALDDARQRSEEKAEAEAERRRAAQRAEEERARTQTQRRAIPQSYLINEPPPQLDHRVALRCLAASENIRLHRNAAYSHPATLTARRSSIVFFPVIERNASFVVPFTWEHDDGNHIDGELSLRSAADPLPIRVRAEPGNEREAELWVTALLGYEALAVLPDEVTARREHHSPRPQTATAKSRGSSPRALPRYPSRRRISPSLTPTGHTIHAHWVTGHIRILPPDWSCSSDARRAALKVGISLQPGETWVRPHARGLEPGDRLTFKWRLPDEARDFIS